MNKAALLEYLDTLISNLISDMNTVEKVVREALKHSRSNEIEYHINTAVYYNEHTLANLKALRDHADSTF